MKAFIQTIANMTQDGEEINGKDFVMENDDAIATLNDLIDRARALVAKQKPKAKPVLDDIKVINGKTYYGRMVNYTTGPKMAYCSFPSDPKRLKRSKAMQAIAAARAAGEIKPVRDWLPGYLKAMPKSIALETAARASFPRWEGEQAETYPEWQARKELFYSEQEQAKADLIIHKRKIFEGK